MSIVIGVCGAIGAGKGEVSLRLAGAFDLPEFAYAEGLKIIASALIGELPESRETKETSQVFTVDHALVIQNISQVFSHFTAAQVEAWANKLETMLKLKFSTTGTHKGLIFVASYREIYQLIGTDWARNKMGESVWIARRPSSCVVNDVRAFKNSPDPYAEARSIVDDGGVVIRVVRDGETEDHSNGHESEFPMDESFISFDVINIGTLEDLDRECDKAYLAICEILNLEPKVIDEPANAKDDTKG